MPSSPKKKPARQKRAASPEFAHAKEEQKRLKREAILKTAIKLFHERNYQGVSLAEVAGQLGMTDAALYYYFRNKSDLAEACILASQAKAQKYLSEAEETGGSGLEKIEIFIRRITSAIAAEEIWFPSAEPYWLDAMRQSAIRQGGEEAVKRLADFLREGMRDKSVHFCEPITTAMLLMGAIFVVRSWMPFSQIGGLTSEKLGEEAAKFITRSLAQGSPFGAGGAGGMGG